jgi:hypothetical protein
MNSNLRIPLLLCIAFGICLGQLLFEFAGMAVSTLIRPLIKGILGKVFDGMDSQYLQIGTFISGSIGLAVTAVLLWLVWQKVAEPIIKKDTTPQDPKP